MNPPPPEAQPLPARPWQTLAAYSVHVYTALGVVFAFLQARELFAAVPDPRWFFMWNIIAVLIDASDGVFARAWHVKTRAPRIDGRTIDDIVDYLTFTFLPLLLVWRMSWAAAPVEAWVCVAMVASLFGFANVAAKQERAGFFQGFPSYWNIVVFYVGLAAMWGLLWLNAAVVVGLALLTVLPVRFLYPNLAPRRWRIPLIGGGGLWLLVLLFMLPRYPYNPPWLVAVSLIYPVFYVVLSLALDWKGRARESRV